ncbi:hypothetical protein GGS20DRAFT_554154 [Poronia punctata]|nr:hypothetical protein GGS20DRAFT_554154 [Poronia punctata]
MSGPTSDDMTPDDQREAMKRIVMVSDKTKQIKTADYVSVVKESALFQPGYNWDDLLSAAPVSISLLANLFVASTIPDAEEITIIPPKGGFKALRNFEKPPSLNACLIQCADQGTQAYGTASASFDMIALKGAQMREMVNAIIMNLGPEGSMPDLKEAIQAMGESATECEKNAKGMEKAFSDWIEMIRELHACVAQTSTDAAARKKANELQLAVAQARLASEKEAKKTAQKSLKTLQNSLKTATSAYKKAAEEYPSGWDLVAMQAVSDLTTTLTNAINQAVPALIENYSATERLKAGVDIFEGNDGNAKGGSAGDGTGEYPNVPPATQAPSPVPSAVPRYSRDPAYGIAGIVSHYVGILQAFVTGAPDKGVEWDVLRSTDPEKQKTGLGVVAALLEDVKNNFVPSQDPPSKDLLDVFANAKKVTDGLQAAITADTDINGPGLPPPDSPKVIEWQKDIKDAMSKVTALDAESKLTTTGQSPPSIDPQKTAVDNGLDKDSAFRKQIIDAATTKLTTTAKVMQVVTDNYREASDNLGHIQEQLGQIQGAIASLKISDKDLTHIKDILVKCIEILVQLKAQVTKLVSFFTAVNTLVDFVVQDQVDRFIEYLEHLPDAETETRILNFTFTDFQRQTIFGFALNIQAYFDLFRDIADMYREVDNKFIQRGIELMTTLQSEYDQNRDKDQLETRKKEAMDFNTQAMEGVKEIVRKRQEEISNNLEKNAAEAADDLNFVSASPPAHVVSAVDQSATKSVEAAKKGIAKSGVYLTHKFSATTSLLEEADSESESG